MELIDQIIFQIDSISDPTLYFIACGVALIVMLVLIRKMFKLFILLVTAAVLYLGWVYYSGGEVGMELPDGFSLGAMIDTVKGFIDNILGLLPYFVEDVPAVPDVPNGT